MTLRYFTIVNLLLIAAGVYLTVDLFYSVVLTRLTPVSPAAPAESSRPADPAASAARPVDTAAIVARNIFKSQAGGTDSPAQAGQLDIENLANTSLQLKLWGTVAGRHGNTYAVIEDTKAREQNLYRPGDTVQNATIKMVLRQKVVLNVNGQDEVLAMEEAGSGPSRGLRAATGSTAPQPRKMPVSAYPRQIRVKGEQLQQALENLGDLMNQATFRPHMENGRPTGIAISGIKPNAIFRKLRLRNGDIITGVNGNSIESVEDALRIFENLATNPEIQIQIKRRGREQTLDYRIE
jgi:general secretion pathway protein C